MVTLISCSDVGLDDIDVLNTKETTLSCINGEMKMT